MKIISAFKTKYPWIFKSIILTPVLMIFAILTVGADGEGPSIILKLLFPYTFYVAAGFQIEDERLLENIGFIGFLLYILYGFILTFAERKGILKETLRILIIAHITAALFCIVLL